MIVRLVFWLSFALVGYAYLGYPLFLFLFARRRVVLKQAATPTVSIVIAVRNEEATLAAKLENLSCLDYPQVLTQIIVVSDGSTDGTAAILGEYAGRSNSRLLPILLDAAGGKASALNEAVRHATGEVLVFLDARQTLDREAVAQLVCCFADPEIGAVSGELLIEQDMPGQVSAGESSDSVGLYWKIEKAVRRLESATGSVVGVTGAIYAIRRQLYTKIPPGTILDDVFIPMYVVRAGKRVVFQPAAVARDRIFSKPGKEFARKVRTLTGNYQLLRLAPWLLTAANPILFRFVSHKLSRLAVPLWLILMLLSSAVIGTAGYLLLFWLQLVFYTVALIGLVLPGARTIKPVGVASTFVMLNAAAVLALSNFLRGRDEVWR